MLSRKIKQATNNYVENIFSSKVEKKWTFSKVLVIAIVTLTIVITIYACIAMWYFNNIDALCYLIPAVFAECATVTGFYSYKAKSENEIKLDTQRKLITTVIKDSLPPQETYDEEDADG